MKSRQVGYVLIALIVIGISGLFYRVVFDGTDEFVLEGLLPINEEIIDQVDIATNDGLTSELIKVNDSYWEVSNNPIFIPKLSAFWEHLDDVPGAQLVARKSTYHSLLGVDEENSTKVSFYVGPSLQEKLHIGKWTGDVRLCYVRKSGKNEVYSIPCSQDGIFSSDPDSWRNPIIMSIIPNDIASFDFIYPDSNESFSVVRTPENDWMVLNQSGVLEGPANLQIIDYLLQSVEVLPASGFEDDSNAKSLDFDAPDGSIRINTTDDSNSPTTRLKLIRKDSDSYFIRASGQSTVYLIQGLLGDFLLMEKSDLLVTD
jgi:hypothetical protein